MIKRRDFLGTLGAGFLLPPGAQTYTYKMAGNLEIKADVYGADPAVRRPVLLWIHGGALIGGHRGQTARQLQGPLLDAGYVVVSIDYRLAPETKLPEIIADVKDAYAWVRTKGPKLFNIDPDRMAVAGGSAGGYLTLMTGFCVKPRPKALVPFWGYGDITSEWYSRPDPFYNKQPEVPKDEAYASVGTTPISEPPDKPNRFRFYLYCRQKGIWPKEVAGHDPDTESKWFDAYCPLRNVTQKYPPTLLIHGTKDTDVPYEQSELMARQLKREGVESELITVEGGGHGLGNIDKAEVSKVYARAVVFIKTHTR